MASTRPNKSHPKFTYHAAQHTDRLHPTPEASKLSEPRITRRMSKAKGSPEFRGGKCVICLGSYLLDYGKLNCGHAFCLGCVQHWWRLHPSCPFCRQEILHIQAEDKRIITFEDLPPEEKEVKDEEFIAHCELCWGEIEGFEEMNICTICRGVYWHRRCLPFKNFKWYCVECAGQREGLD